ncbi:predicted protein [Brucella sp. NVSL 07-0026]|nr:predicted protein [Brucella sp. NVSL 07-0026]
MPETDKYSDIGTELDLLREAAREAGRIAMHYFGRSPEVWLKDGVSPVSEADLAVDRFLKETLLAARPDYGWISEETVDERAAAERSRAFVVDPIDGTRAYIGGQDQWCVSIAIIENGSPVAGVLECPVREELLEAGKGLGARQNGCRFIRKCLLRGRKLPLLSRATRSMPCRSNGAALCGFILTCRRWPIALRWWRAATLREPSFGQIRMIGIWLRRISFSVSRVGQSSQARLYRSFMAGRRGATALLLQPAETCYGKC